MEYLWLALDDDLCRTASRTGGFRPYRRDDDDEQTGLEVGARIPDFRAIDQNGKAWDFDALKGPNGAVFLFHRSADW